MNNNAAEFVFIVNLRNKLDVKVEKGITELSWDEFKDDLLRPSIRESKEGPGFMPVMMKLEQEWQEIHVEPTEKNPEGYTHYRGDVNVEAITSLVIDLDQPGALERAEPIFAGYEYVVYSTHNYNEKQQYKYRMVIRLAEPIMVDNWPMCFMALKSRINLDPQCCNPSRFYYYPSHSPNAKIPPRSFHRQGRAMTLEDVLALAADGVDLSQAKLVKFAGTLDPNKIERRRHFSGITIGAHEAVSDQIDYSIESLNEVHSHSLERFKIEGSYHVFARDVVAREIGKYGHKMDIKKTVMYICQMGLALSNRPLEAGDTEVELPGMILRGLLRFAPGSYKELLDQHGEGLTAWVQSQVRWGIASYRDDPLPDLPQNAKVSEAKEEGDFYAVLRRRHMRLIREYVNTGDFTKLLNGVVEMELKATRPNCKEIARALLKYSYGFSTECRKLPEAEALARVKRDAKTAAERLSKANFSLIDETKLKYLKTDLLIQANKWIPKHQPKVVRESAGPSM
ncbi:hypothetical protein ACYPKM_03055 [Pseudomonas aeruginosa]